MNPDDEPTTLGPRHDIGAEQYILGAILQSAGRVIPELDLHPADFYRPQHEALWTLLTRMHATGQPVEHLAVLGQLQTTPIPGITAATLHDLDASCATWVNADYYARHIAALSRLRRMQQAATKLAHSAATCDPTETDTLAAAARADLDTAAATTGGPDTLTPFSDLFLQALERWESTETGILPTGLHDLDRMLSGGLRPGHLTVIGARPSVGKSVVASVVAHTIAARGIGVLFSSLEMSRHEVIDRITADAAGIELDRLTRRALTPDDWDRTNRVMKTAADWPLYIDDRANVTVNAIRGRARDVTHRTTLGLIVVDYLQLVRPTDTRLPRQEQVAGISRNLKLAARELDVPVVALAQVNRGPMARGDKRPVMSDLRESGAIEADADEIVLLHRDEDTPGVIEFIVEKNRHGRTGRIDLAWSPHYSRVASMARAR